MSFGVFFENLRNCWINIINIQPVRRVMRNSNSEQMSIFCIFHGLHSLIFIIDLVTYQLYDILDEITRETALGGITDTDLLRYYYARFCAHLRFNLRELYDLYRMIPIIMTLMC
jgi:hypothetical protein